MNRLTILKTNDDVNFENYSNELEDFLIDAADIQFESGSSMYVGLRKPFHQFFLKVNNVFSTKNMTGEYWNGTAWEELPQFRDQTLAFVRKGFLSWNFENKKTVTNYWKKNTIDGSELYWIKLSVDGNVYGSLLSLIQSGSTDTVLNIADEDISKYSVSQKLWISSEDSYHTISAVDSVSPQKTIEITPALTAPPAENDQINEGEVEFVGLNNLFSNDNDLLEKYRNIMSFKDENDDDFIWSHQAVRKDIIQKLRNEGFSKKRDGEEFLRNIDHWDILESEELRQASAYYALAMIFGNASDNKEGKWRQKERDYSAEGDSNFNLFLKTIDLDDDGQRSLPKEDTPDHSIRIYRR
jgi:hypothetical protein